DGRFVAFDSNATNFVAGDTNYGGDVFVRDRATGTTTCVSVDTNGIPANAPSLHPSMSADGRYVAFQSTATNLGAVVSGLNDVFVRDLQTLTTTKVSQGLLGPADNYCGTPSISDDGRFVTFAAWATNLVANDVAGYCDVFLRDLVANTTTR